MQCNDNVTCIFKYCQALFNVRTSKIAIGILLHSTFFMQFTNSTHKNPTAINIFQKSSLMVFENLNLEYNSLPLLRKQEGMCKANGTPGALSE